jgi:hypothetical protein
VADAVGAFPLAMGLGRTIPEVVSLQAGRSLDRRLTELRLHVSSRVEVRQRRGAGVVIAPGKFPHRPRRGHDYEDRGGWGLRSRGWIAQGMWV